MSEWIPVAEQHPVPITDVLVAYRNLEGVFVTDAGYMRNDGRWCFLGMERVFINDVLAWMPFPAPPTMEVEE